LNKVLRDKRKHYSLLCQNLDGRTKETKTDSFKRVSGKTYISFLKIKSLTKEPFDEA